MLEQGYKNINKKTVILSVILFFVFAILVYLFPYSGDDWAWGSQLGLARLANHFDNYNGRYAGNLLVLALTRSEVLNFVVIGASLVCICLFPKLFSDSKKFTVYVFGILLFLLIPKQIFVQSVVWTSGYSNYVPPILMSLLYFIIIKNIFDKDKPSYHRITFIFAAIIGFISALFMENVTLYNIAISAIIIFFVIIKFKKICLTHLAHLMGSIAGAGLMFSNSVYRSIASGSDGYRSTAFDSDLKETIIEHTEVIFQQFFANNIIILIIFSLLCVAIYILYARTSSDKKLKSLGLLLILLNVFSCFMIYSKNAFAYWFFGIGHAKSDLITIGLFALVAIIYFGSALLTVFICVDSNKNKFKTLFLLISVPILIAPLVFVNPIGPRCFFPPYLMLISACVLLFVHIQNKMNITAETNKGIAISLLAGCLALFTFLFSIYSTIHTYDIKRNDYVKKQIEAGRETVTVCLLPYASYVWVRDPSSAPWDYRYKLFHGIDTNIQFEFLNYKEFDKWAEEFDKEVNSK